jgi:hypothetical protein
MERIGKITLVRKQLVSILRLKNMEPLNLKPIDKCEIIIFY